MILDILQTVCSFTHHYFRGNVKITLMTKFTEENLFVYKIKSAHINQKTLQKWKYSKLISLNINDNKHVNNLDHLSHTLTELHCARSCVTQVMISKLKKLRILYGNVHIYDLSHICDTIEDLSNCNINQEQLYKLNKIKKLSVNYNPHVYDLSHLKETLVYLECCGYDSGIDQNSINGLDKLHILKCDGNKKITNVNKWKNSLVVLHCKSSGILQEGISDLKVLETFVTDTTICRRDRQLIHGHCFDITHISGCIREIECKYIDQCTLDITLNLETLITNPHYIKKLDHLAETLSYIDFGSFPIDRNIIKNLHKLNYHSTLVCV